VRSTQYAVRRDNLLRTAHCAPRTQHMSIIKNNLGSNVKAKKGAKVAIAVSRYNREITSALLDSCKKELIKRGVLNKNIEVAEVPGAFELVYACKRLVDLNKYDAVIALGAVIRGETPHFDFIAFAVSKGIMELNLENKIPVIFGLLTTENLKQARDRIKGGKRGDKGAEAAITALEMINLKI
jgi:6,7-dimethyl-8-ribityllumazine synthase